MRNDMLRDTIRKLLLPAIAVAMLGGCMTSGHSYRQDGGGYYYGQPSTEYRYYGSPYGIYDRAYRYGYPGYSSYRHGYGGFGAYYGSPYFGSPYFGSPYRHYTGPYYPYRPRPVIVVPPRPNDPTAPPPRDRGDRRPPWRNLDELGRRQRGDPPLSEPSPAMLAPGPTALMPPRPVMERPMTQRPGPEPSEPAIRRSREQERDREIE